MSLTKVMSSASVPVNIKRLTDETSAVKEQPNGSGLEIHWSTGEINSFSSKLLRESCPCATCLEARGDTTHAKPLSGKSSLLQVVKSTIDEETDLIKVWPVGNYAIGLLWGDNHNTGIYTYDLLRQLRGKTGKV